MGRSRALQKIFMRRLCPGKRILPAIRTIRHRPSDLRKRENCHGRASVWLRTCCDGNRIPGFMFVARVDAFSVSTSVEIEAAVDLATKTLLP